MMRNVWMVKAGLVLALVATLLLVGCLSGSGNTTGGLGTDPNAAGIVLTAAEQQAITVGVASTESLALATQVTQTATGDEDGSSSEQVIPGISPVGSVNREFGTCPRVSLVVANDTLLVFNLTIDFGVGCQPAFAEEYLYTGSATGTYNRAQKTIRLSFDDFTSNNDGLDGTVNASYDRGQSTVVLDGAWDLTGTSPEYGTLQTAGQGRGAYNLDTYTTTIEEFIGTLTDPDAEYEVTMTEILISFPTYERYIPYGGEMAMSGDDIRDITLRFSTKSPTEGIIEVKIGDGPYVAYSIYSG